MGCDPPHDLMSKRHRSYKFYRLYDSCSIPPRELVDNLQLDIAVAGDGRA